MQRRFFWVYECGSDDDDDVMHPTSGRIRQFASWEAVMAHYDDHTMWPEYDRMGNIALRLSFDYHVFAMFDGAWLIVHDKSRGWL